MRTLTTLLIVLTLTLVAANVGAAQQPLVASRASVDWLEHRSAEGRYRAEFPSEPKLQTQPAKSPEGSSFTQYFAMASDDTGMYMVAYFDYTSEQTFSLEKARDGMIKAVNGTLVSDQVMNLNAAPGREFKTEAKLQNGKFVFTMARILDVNGRVYVLQHMFYKETDPAMADSNTQKFFKSFSVIPPG